MSEKEVRSLRDRLLRTCAESEYSVHDCIQAVLETLVTIVIDSASDASDADRIINATADCITDNVHQMYEKRYRELRLQ
jgi:hypothetical protein